MSASIPTPHSATAHGEQGEHKSKGGYIEWMDRKDTFFSHGFPEHIVDLGEIRMNYAVAGSSDNPALLLIPGQTESWWTYESAMRLLADSYQVYAVDLRGQGRSTWTPGRYSLDIFGNDLVRFIDRVIGRPVVVSGLSSGGVLSAWLSAFASPGQILAAVYEDPPLFSSQKNPPIGHSIDQTFAGPLFRLWTKWLGPQWSIGNIDGMMDAMRREMPNWLMEAQTALGLPPIAFERRPELRLREYDPEWAESFWTGKGAATCDHETMLKQVKVPVLFTHHSRHIDPRSGNLLGAISDLQARHVQRLVEGTGNSFTYISLPDQPHNMHSPDPVTYVTTVTTWLAGLGLGTAIHPKPTATEPNNGE
ncbi:hydrolase [Thozetella sp. PMI_491]|nr:hydrolase [Thozetella sp. PMI_491]